MEGMGGMGAVVGELEEALSLEAKFQPHLELPAHSSSEVTLGIRDGSAHVLRCLKVWYDLPSDVFFVAANLMDRFLTKMKVRPKHMACISVAAFQLGCLSVVEGGPPEGSDVLAISQCKCTVGDLSRMMSVISAKLEAHEPPVTPARFLKLFHTLLLAVDIDQVYARAVRLEEVIQKLEVVTCDAGCSNFRASEVALMLLCVSLDTGVAALKPSPPSAAVISLLSFIAQLQNICQMCEAKLSVCHGAVLSVVERYNCERQTPHRQRLVWRLSQRTLRRLRPTDRLVSTLPTIDEYGQLHIPPRHRGSSSSEEGWSNFCG